jgi:iron(III) transport system ATP-binding protein|tara:strand:- start:284 stop:1285 length:1002 start_codon:yes stop_codon:yes gene_type:complete
MNDSTLSVSEVSLVYPQSPNAVLNQTSLTLAQGQIACLLGASGCGKTSLLRCIAGFETPSEGSIYLGKIQAFGKQQVLPVERRRIGMVFQDYALFPHLTVAANIGFGLKNSPIDYHQHASIVHDTLSLLGLLSEAEKYPHQISGGQQQRVAIGRAIAPKPTLLLLDEPFSNLDLHLRERLAHDLRHLLKSQNMTALMVTHDQQEAFAFADKIGVMHQGKIEQWGSADSIYRQPQTDYVANFIGDGAVLTQIQAKSLKLPANNAGIYLLRPEHLKLAEDSNLSAKIISVHPQGHSTLLRGICQVEADTPIKLMLRCDANQKIQVGEAVNFSLAL